MWHSLDDKTIRQVSEKMVLHQKAYMLFYVRDVKSLAPRKPHNATRKENIMASAVGARDNHVPKVAPVNCNGSQKSLVTREGKSILSEKSSNDRQNHDYPRLQGLSLQSLLVMSQMNGSSALLSD